MKTYDKANRTKDFTWHYTGEVNLAYEIIDHYATSKQKNKIALCFKKEDKIIKYTYYELKVKSEQYAVYLKKQGVSEGSRVYLLLEDLSYKLIFLLAIVKIGAIAVVNESKLSDKEINESIEEVKAKTIITDLKKYGKIESEKNGKLKIILLDELDKNKSIKNEDFKINWVNGFQEYLIVYRKKEGKIKGFTYTHDSMIYYYHSSNHVFQYKEEDVVLHCNRDIQTVINSWMHGTTVVIAKGENIEELYKVIEKIGVTIWNVNKNIIDKIKKELGKKFNTKTIEKITIENELPSNDTKKWFRQLGINLIVNWTFGDGNGILISDVNCKSEDRFCMGKALPGIELNISDVNTLLIKSDWESMPKRIWGEPETYHDLFIGDWFITDKQAIIDEEGICYEKN